MEHKLIRSISSWLLFIVLLVLIASCKNEPTKSPEVEVPITPVRVPKFNKDTAFTFIEKQLSFGFRVPGSEASRQCKDWIVSKMETFGAKVTEQEFKTSFLDQKNVSATNIIAEINPSIKRRILLCAHYDSRLIAEKDSDQSRLKDPIYGADDGASGPAALIEIARVLQSNPIELGVDIIFFDAEDQGENEGASSTWCLGSQHWTKNPHRRNYKAQFGILLDMIAAEGAIFHKEGHSYRYAKESTDKIWKLAQAMGNKDLFQNRVIGGITDDHYYINTVLGIPTVDIINTAGMASGKTFGDYHHTHGDNIEIIDKRILKVVGQVVTAVIYKTYDRSFQRL